MEDIGEETTI